MKRWISKDSIISKLGFALIILMAVLGLTGSLHRGQQQNAVVQKGSTVQDTAAQTAMPLSEKPKVPVVETHVETTEEAVPYDTVQTYDGTLSKGTTLVRVDGVDGKKVVKTEVKTKDGAEISRELISEEVTVAPVTKIVAIGTKAEPKDQDNADNACDPHYTPCVKKVGDKLDCADIGYQVQLVKPGDDPYGLDANHDGIGCEDYPKL